MGAKSLIRGVRLSVRLPRRMVPICVVEPMGFARPRRTASTPAINVVATAPIPGIMMPSLPVAGVMSAAWGVVAASGVDMFLVGPFCGAVFRQPDRLVSPVAAGRGKWLADAFRA